MLRGRNAGWCGVATVLVFGLVTPAFGLPGAAETMRAYQTARSAVDGLEAEASEILAPGAAVTVRVGGRVAGYAAVWESDGSAFDAALRMAIADFQQTEMAPRDATRRVRLLELAARATVQVELADALTPVAGETFGIAGLGLSPGLHGAAARVGDRVAAVFPDRMLSTDTTAAQGLTAACAALELPARPLLELEERFSVRVFRFDAVCVGQIVPGGSATFLHRSGKVRSITSVVGGELESFGAMLAGSLERRVWERDGAVGLLGTYHPVRDAYEPLEASALETALGALALARWGNVQDDAVAQRSAGLLLGSVDVGADTSAAALVLLAVDALGDPEELAGLASVCAGVIDGYDGGGALSEEGLIAAALAVRGEARARTMVGDVIASAGRGGVVTAAPWIVWAAVAVADDGRVGGAPALREGRDVVWEHQITRRDAGTAEADLVGGVVYTASGQPLPTAQSARAACLAAAMLGNASLTPENERAGELARVLPTLRFLRQLMVEEAEARMYPNGDRAMGGVRLALWDQRQPVEATAMTLIAVAETVEARK